MITKIDEQDSLTIGHNQHPAQPSHDSKTKLCRLDRDNNLYKSVGHISTVNPLLLNKIRDNTEKFCFKQSLPRLKISKQEKGVSRPVKKNKSRTTLLEELEEKIYGLKQSVFGDVQKEHKNPQTFSSTFPKDDIQQRSINPPHSSPQKQASIKSEREDSQKQHLISYSEKKKVQSYAPKIQTKEGINDYLGYSPISQTKQRASAPIRFKSEANLFWEQVFSKVKLKGRQVRNSIQENEEQQIQAQNRQNQERIQAIKTNDHQLGLLEKNQDKKLVSRSECDNFHGQEQINKMEREHKNSLELLNNIGKRPRQQKCLKKTCERSSKILKNTKILLQSIRSSPYYPSSPQQDIKSEQEKLFQRIESKIGRFNLPKKEINFESIPSQRETKNSNIHHKQTNHQNLANQSSSTTFTNSPQFQNHSFSFSNILSANNFSVSQVSNQENLSRQNIDTNNIQSLDSKKHHQPRKRICSPVNGRPPKQISLADFRRVPLSQAELKEEQSLGKGKFGDVFLGMHIETRMLFALKQIQKQKIKKYRMVEQVIDEIKIHRTLCHPNITKMFGYFSENDKIYLVLEYIEGGTLFEYLNEVGSIPLKTTLKLLRDVIRAVTYMHERSIAHRDIKPQNILLANKFSKRNSEMCGTAKLCDFGWSALMETSRRTYCGTFDYVPPEVLQRKKYDISVDVWSIGVLTYQMLTGKVPYEGDRSTVIFNKINQVQIEYPELSTEFPIEAKNFIQALVRKNPAERPKCKDLLKMPIFTKYSRQLQDELQTIFQSPKRKTEKRQRIINR